MLSPAESLLLRYLGSEQARHDGEAAADLAREATAAGLGSLCKKSIERWLVAFEGGQYRDLRQLAEDAGENSGEILALACAPSVQPGFDEARGSVATIRTKSLRARLRALQEEIDNARDPDAQGRLAQEKVHLVREIQGLGSAPEAH